MGKQNTMTVKVFPYFIIVLFFFCFFLGTIFRAISMEKFSFTEINTDGSKNDLPHSEEKISFIEESIYPSRSPNSTINSITSVEYIDYNSDSLIEAIVISVNITVVQDGIYQLIGNLTSSESSYTYVVKNTSVLEEGNNILIFHFAGKTIRREKMSGNFNIQELILFYYNDTIGKIENCNHMTSGHPLEAHDFTDFEPNYGYFTGNVQSMPGQTNEEGFYDSLEFSVEIHSSLVEFFFSVYGEVYTEADEFISLINKNDVLSTGSFFVKLTLDGQTLSDLEYSGRLVLKNMALYDRNGLLLDKWPWPYTTDVYSHIDFDPSTIIFNSVESDCSIDQNGDGSLDAISFNVTAKIKESGNYHIYAYLATLTGDNITFGKNILDCTAGEQTLELIVEVKELVKERINGPYRLTLVKAFHFDGKLVGSFYPNYETRPYGISDFSSEGVGKWELPFDLSINQSDVVVSADGDDVTLKVTVTNNGPGNSMFILLGIFDKSPDDNASRKLVSKSIDVLLAGQAETINLTIEDCTLTEVWVAVYPYNVINETDETNNIIKLDLRKSVIPKEDKDETADESTFFNTSYLNLIVPTIVIVIIGMAIYLRRRRNSNR